MVGPYGDWIKHSVEQKTVLVSECDGVRLISAEQHELLSRVPDSLVDIFKIGSTAPGQPPYFPQCPHSGRLQSRLVVAQSSVCGLCHVQLLPDLVT